MSLRIPNMGNPGLGQPALARTMCNDRRGVETMVNWFDEPKAANPRKKLTKDQRFEVWKKYIGATKAEGPCYVCKKTIHVTDFDVGHNIARAKGGSDNIPNFRPICRQCNRGMGTMSIETYKAKLNGPATTADKKKASPKPKRKATARKKQADPFDLFSF